MCENQCVKLENKLVPMRASARTCRPRASSRVNAGEPVNFYYVVQQEAALATGSGSESLR